MAIAVIEVVSFLSAVFFSSPLWKMEFNVTAVSYVPNI